MAEQTGIEWTDHTFNPWWGCEKVSPGCAHCYAETLSDRFTSGLWGEGHRFRFFGDKHWAEPLKWNRKAEAEGIRRRVFCASMADVFEERDELVPHRGRLFRTIISTPHLDWQILTKRPELARHWLRGMYAFTRLVGAPVPLPNVWLGVSIENARHTWRADVLRDIPAAVRFISAEPLLGSLFETSMSARRETPSSDEIRHIRRPLDLTGIDWVIVGGESGPGARPMNPDWAREIRDVVLDWPGGSYETRVRAGRRPAFLFKQWGEWSPNVWKVGDRFDEKRSHAFRVGNRLVWVERVGKKKAGRELDGRTWDEFPRAQVPES